MKAAYLTGIRKVEVRDIPAPQAAGTGQVLLRIDTVGVCGSDMHYYRTGRIGQQIVKFPWIVGHECAGTIVQVGPQVHGLEVGDRVAVDPLVACGECDQCLEARSHTCRRQSFMGVPDQMPGSLVEQVVLPAHCCVPIPRGMTMEQAVMIEPLAIGLYASRRLAPTARDVAILGSGPIGLCVLACLKAQYDVRVLSTDLRDERLALARRLGAEWTGNAATADVEAAILSACPGGVSAVFECAGKQETLDQALRLLRPGGTLLIVGIPDGDRVSFDMNHMRRKELTVLNIRRQNLCVEPAIDLVASGRVDVDCMITHRFTLEQTQQTFDMVADYRDGAVKAMIHLGAQ